MTVSKYMDGSSKMYKNDTLQSKGGLWKQEIPADKEPTKDGAFRQGASRLRSFKFDGVMNRFV